MANNSFVEFCWISSVVSKRRFFQGRLQFRKQKKVRWSQIWRVGWLGYNGRFVFCLSCKKRNDRCAQGTTSELVRCRGATPNSGSSITEASSGVRLPSNASELLRKTPCLLPDHVERIRGGLYLASQRKPTTSHSCWIDSFELSSVGAILAPPIVTTETWF